MKRCILNLVRFTGGVCWAYAGETFHSRGPVIDFYLWFAVGAFLIGVDLLVPSKKRVI